MEVGPIANRVHIFNHQKETNMIANTPAIASQSSSKKTSSRVAAESHICTVEPDIRMAEGLIVAALNDFVAVESGVYLLKTLLELRAATHIFCETVEKWAVPSFIYRADGSHLHSPSCNQKVELSDAGLLISKFATPTGVTFLSDLSIAIYVDPKAPDVLFAYVASDSPDTTLYDLLSYRMQAEHWKACALGMDASKAVEKVLACWLDDALEVAGCMNHIMHDDTKHHPLASTNVLRGGCGVDSFRLRQ